jgi:hypothetical protein
MSFRVDAMTLMWSDVVVMAAASKSWDEPRLRRELGAKGISSATITNWKGGKKAGSARPIPPSQWPTIAGTLRLSVDALLSKKTDRVAEPTLVYGNADAASKLLAAEISKLNPNVRELVTSLVEVLVAQSIRDEREIGKPEKKGKSRLLGRREASQ